MSTGAKVGIGFLVGCTGAVLITIIIVFAMGAWTCHSCASCCKDMQELADKAAEEEKKEEAKLRPVGETVNLGSFNITVTDAQRQENTVVVTLDIENTSYSAAEIDPKMFKIEDSGARIHRVDTDKCALTMDGLQAGDTLEQDEVALRRVVFTVPQEATGLVLEITTTDYGSKTRRFSLGV